MGGLILCLCIAALPPRAPFCPALGRPLSWDPFGAYALDAEAPLTKAGVEIVKDFMDAELGRVELIARHRLAVDPDDLVPAWAMAQVVRARKQGIVEYRRAVEGHAGEPATLPVRLYRFHVCRIALKDLLDNRRNDPEKKLYWALDRDLKALRDASKEDARGRLGVAIGLTNAIPFWVLSDRSILQSYQDAHPKGPDVRPLLCRAYFNGVVPVDGKSGKLLDSPDPQKALEVAQSILKERPRDPLGLYYRGRGFYALKKTNLAARDIGAALATGGLPAIFENIAKEFLKAPSEAAFYSVKAVD